MACNDNISNLCLEPIKSTCVDFDGQLGDNTKITEDCVNQHEVNEDLYQITDEIIEGLDTSALSDNCLTYPLPMGVTLIPVSKALEVHGDEICTLKDRVTALENKDYSSLDITGFGLDFGCLVDPCGDPITELGTLLQLIINKACE